MVDIALVFSSLILSWKESFIVTNKFPIPEKKLLLWALNE